MDDLSGNICLAKQSPALTKSLLALATNTAVQKEFPDLDHYVKNLMGALQTGDIPLTENALLSLYTRLHGAGARYSPEERERLSKRKGYACYPGGLSPLIRAVQFIRPDSVVADLGAGNGLQGLLLQCICPHRKTIQVEISSALIRVGQIFQHTLGIEADRIEWIHDDIVHVSIEEADFIYLYLPAKPLDGGKEVYEAIARKLNRTEKPIVIFSIADCLAGFLGRRFSVVYTDGHLTCFIKK
ncbi:MAG: class I SAM-dependent methyltransferase [Thermodesulfovibrionales bacterium]|nr:class I SAM-dependent methyltransferase [Thermodesulfovibrionales bacterium]